MGVLKNIKLLLLINNAKKKFGEDMKSAGLQATLFGLAGALGSSLLAVLESSYPGLTTHWKEILFTAIMTGVGKWMHSNRST